MKNDICSKIQETLLLNQEAPKNLSQEVRDHLALCEECRRFAIVLEKTVPSRPAPKLDAITLARCKAALPLARPQARAWHRIWAVAASIAILFALTLFWTKEHRPAQPDAIDDATGDLQFEEMLLDTEISLPQKDLDNAELELGLFVCDL